MVWEQGEGTTPLISKKKETVYHERIECCRQEMRIIEWLKCSPTKYIYRCDNCGREYTSEIEYPRTIRPSPKPCKHWWDELGEECILCGLKAELRE